MDAKKLEKYLYDHIPITQALGMRVDKASKESVIVNALFANNINHKMTAFGPSLYAVATVSCWGLLYMNLQHASSDIVIVRSDIDYFVPVTSDFCAKCDIPSEQIWLPFIKILQRKGKAKVSLASTIFQGEKLAVSFSGEFAALNRISW